MMKCFSGKTCGRQGRSHGQSSPTVFVLALNPAARRFAIGMATFLLFAVAGLSVQAATLPTGFTETLVAGGLSSPTAMAFAPDGRLFVCLQGGQLRVIKNGALLPTPFMTLTTDASGERGLLGITFDPNFATNNFLYVYYTVTTTPRHNRVSRFTANGDLVVAASELPILDLENLSATNHNGGAIHFGPDGKLYVAVGENAVGSNSQTLNNRLGKLLRVNADGSIPTDNPFFNTASGNNRAIWALGLRNPYTFAFQPGTTRMFINDVGQSSWEEINDGIAGSNYGWPTTEGPTTNPNFRTPLFAYGRTPSSTGGCAITGGAFYNPPANQFPASYTGKYFFADFCSGWIRLLDPSNNTATDFATGVANPVDLQVGSDGSLYYLARGSAAVFRIQYTAVAPTIATHPSDRTVAQGETANFQVVANGSTPLSYQWQRNMIDIAGANSASYTTPATVLADNGAKFRCVVTNAFGTATSNEATLTVTAPPSIATHPSDQTVTEGQTATFSVSANGSAPLSYQWQRNMVNITGANAASYMTPATVMADNGAKFRCVVTNAFGTANSNEATLTVQPVPPMIVTEENTDIAIALGSVHMLRDPFPLTTVFNFSSDQRTRIMFFALNADLLPGETSSAVTCVIEDAQQVNHPATVEFVGKIPDFNSFTEVVIRLPDSLIGNGDVFIIITIHGRTSNKARIRLR